MQLSDTSYIEKSPVLTGHMKRCVAVGTPSGLVRTAQCQFRSHRYHHHLKASLADSACAFMQGAPRALRVSVHSGSRRFKVSIPLTCPLSNWEHTDLSLSLEAGAKVCYHGYMLVVACQHPKASEIAEARVKGAQYVFSKTRNTFVEWFDLQIAIGITELAPHRSSPCIDPASFNGTCTACTRPACTDKIVQ